MGKFRKRKIITVILLILITIVAMTQVRGYMTWRNMDTFQRFAISVGGSVDDKKVLGSVVKIESKDKTLQYEAAEGNLSTDDIFCIASTTKMFTATIIFQLVDEGLMQLTDTLDMYLTQDELEGLHYYNGHNYAQSITIEQLISQTTGLPDHYLEEVDNKSIFEEIVEEDRTYEFEDFLQRVKMLEPHFVNGTEGKAYYADINFDILGLIAERLTKKGLEALYHERIFDPLRLENTSLATVNSQFAPIYLNEEIFEVALAKSSMGASGGLISNVNDLMIFLRGFMEGELFSSSHIDRGDWNEIQFDYHQYRNGLMRFELTGVWSLFGSYELIGHSGSTGGFAFYSPEKEVYIVGTTNQATDPSIQYRLMNQLIGSIGD
ncbi:beta-lactamase [Alkaliphilus metalliredigens QYMF]|uniref:Beta-lactamase n=1 Tax=Alkaliphilus metalliredigens (strain QYMF) TaxID=293826 RepID=A6TNH7_ALKMQ|nr:serine hydrolase domain-containing protein [Alkaliphilus metalliredigens]ABR47745.1 beta-lactamase [Alkaliphilus metalliredigens QYMF]